MMVLMILLRIPMIVSMILVAHQSSAGRRISIWLGKVTCCGEITPLHDLKSLHLSVKLHQRNTDNLSIWIGE